MGQGGFLLLLFSAGGGGGFLALGRGGGLRTKNSAQMGDVPVELALGNFAFVEMAFHVFPVIFKSLLADLAVLELRGPQTDFRVLGNSAVDLLLLGSHLVGKLLVLRLEVALGIGLNAGCYTFSEGSRKAGVKWRRSLLKTGNRAIEQAFGLSQLKGTLGSRSLPSPGGSGSGLAGGSERNRKEWDFYIGRFSPFNL